MYKYTCSMQWMKLHWESVWTVYLSTMKFVLTLLVYVQPLILFLAGLGLVLELKVHHMDTHVRFWMIKHVGHSHRVCPAYPLVNKVFHPWILSLHLALTQHYWASSLAWHLALSLRCSPATPSSDNCDHVGSPISGSFHAWLPSLSLHQLLLQFSS